MRLKQNIALALCISVLVQPVLINAEETEAAYEVEETVSSAAFSFRREVPNSNGIYLAELPQDECWFECGNMNIGSMHLEDKDGNRLTEDYIYLNPLSGRAGLYEYAIPAGHADMWCGVLAYRDGQTKILEEAGLTSYCGVDAGEASFYFPVFTSGEYYDADGNTIENLGTYLKPFKISLERDSWAEKAITDAINRGYMPPTLAYNYRSNITRREYCRLAMAAYEHINGAYRGDAFTDKHISPFNDVDDCYVSAAADLGIVNGMGNGSFEPDRFITRQEAAVLLCNLAGIIDRDTDIQSVSAFADDTSIADWAKASVYEICGIKSHNGDGVMVGVGNNRFSPTTQYTRQQAVVTIYRLLDDYDE